jgi:hypothetical protein
MLPNRRAQERERAAERKAAADAREVISRAERSASRRARRRRVVIRDAALALAVALILFGVWKSIPLAVALWAQ